MAVGNHPSGGLGPLPLFSGETATSDATAGVYNLATPVRHFSLQVDGTTDATVVLLGGLSSASTGLETLISWSSGVVGAVVSTESTGPFSRITATFDGGASSGTPMSAWFSATP